MDIWIIQNGEKAGPIHDFEVRKKIEAGELPASTPAWHEGLPAWKPLGEISLFEREYDRPFGNQDPPHAPPEQAPEHPAPPPLPDKPYSIRRFWARWFDLFLFAGVWWIAMWASGRDIEATLKSPWIIFLQYVPWFVLEAFLLHRFGTTPGKWLLGLKVVNHDGTPLSLAEATRRSARVLFIGIGFGWMPLALICQVLAWFTTKRLGRPLWDQAGGHRLIATPLIPWRIVAYVFLLFSAFLLQAIALFPYALEEAKKNNPAFKEQWEKLREDMNRSPGTPPGKS